MGKWRFDPLVASEVETGRHLTKELKSNGVAGENLLSRMSSGSGQIPGLIVPFGASAVRDDGMPEISEKWSDHSRGTLFDILDAWKDRPKPEENWPDALRRERTLSDPGRLRLTTQTGTTRSALSNFPFGK